MNKKGELINVIIIFGWILVISIIVLVAYGLFIYRAPVSKMSLEERMNNYGDNVVVLGINVNNMNVTPQIDYFMTNNKPGGFDEVGYYIYSKLNKSVIIYPRYIVWQGNTNGCEENFCAESADSVINGLCTYYYLGINNYYEYSINHTLNLNIKNCTKNERRNILLDEKNVAKGILNISNDKVFINGIPYNGSTDKKSVLKAVCSEYANPPKGCN